LMGLFMRVSFFDLQAVTLPVAKVFRRNAMDRYTDLLPESNK